MSEEVNELLDKLGKLEDAPLIWINKKVYDTPKEIERLQNQLQQKENIIKEVREYIMSELITEWDIRNDGHVIGSDLPVDAITPILEILDKVD